MAAQAAGGFIPYSPPASSVVSSNTAQSLPHPRSTPLRPGGTKESSFIRHVDQQILHIQRRFAKRRVGSDELMKETDEEGRVIEEVDDHMEQLKTHKSNVWDDGYNNFGEAARDLEELIGVIWVSGTPSLQVPYLIALALLTNTMINGFPASPRQLFRLLAKFDHAFASLLQACDIETGQALPGFDLGRKVSTTEKVRIKGLIERTRVSVNNAMAKGGFDDEPEEETADEDDDGDLMLDDDDDLIEDQSWDMQIAKVYDNTLIELGDTLDGPEIGIRTEPAG